MNLPHPLEGDRQVAQCILPTHQCFDDAIEILLELLTTERVPPHELRLVHAICRMEDDNRRFAHAWVEHGQCCLFLGLYQGARVLCRVARHDHYQRLRVQERTKYTPWQACRESQPTRLAGPWKPQYRALLRE